MTRFRVEIDDREATAALRRLLDAGRDLSPLMARLAATLADSVEESFKRQASPNGAWAPLAPSTVRDRLRKGYRAGPILQRSGQLVGSVQADHDRSSATASVRKSAKGANIALFLHEGTSRMPARPYLALWPEHERQIADDVRAFVLDAWRG